MTVDEILVSGRYTDRRGRMWERKSSDGWWYHFPSSLRLTPPQMLLLIERDQHRDECVGLGICSDHPAWIVSRGYNEDGAPGWEILRPHKNQGRLLDLTHADAMSAARALAVGE